MYLAGYIFDTHLDSFPDNFLDKSRASKNTLVRRFLVGRGAGNRTPFAGPPALNNNRYTTPRSWQEIWGCMPAPYRALLRYLGCRYTMPWTIYWDYLGLERVLMHLVQAKILFPANSLKAFLFVSAGTRTHWRLGYLLFLTVGLYFPRSFSRWLNIPDFFSQIWHFFAMI